MAEFKQNVEAFSKGGFTYGDERGRTFHLKDGRVVNIVWREESQARQLDSYIAGLHIRDDVGGDERFTNYLLYPDGLMERYVVITPIEEPGARREMIRKIEECSPQELANLTDALLKNVRAQMAADERERAIGLLIATEGDVEETRRVFAEIASMIDESPVEQRPAA